MGSLIHSCHSADLNEPLPAKCSCKKRLNDDELRERLSAGEITEIVGHPGQFGWVGRRKRTPRVPTVERAHIERALGQNEIDKLFLSREETKRDYEEENARRLEVYEELEREMWAGMTIPEVPDAWGEGRCLFSNSWEDERTSIGKDIESSYLPAVFDEPTPVEGDDLER